MTELDKLKMKYSVLIGEYLGTLEGISWWKIPKDLQEIINTTKQDLRNKADKLADEFYPD